ncbi:HD domain-containing phosphohydrolase [Aeoliella mucimassa]|uniref:Cyclic di-GMP phosphodiesterase response regulator RpfG n=1 Tax=Aeoliella mucimassa TaxID=2527972 RepID=A0A518AHJ3_9BACT|nr:HD domain-containing phosphohydrolase [Aeoliella mucimassa]QDU54165.1 Cyclic di-GMP phosphodiesterase response regulator RpfG [Aeoliella mucimassa]
MSLNRILFIDDEHYVLRAYARILHPFREEWTMSFHQDAMSAWDGLLESSADVVVSDINMPGMSGLQLLERMQEHPDMIDIPVIIVTGRDDNGLKSRALSLGATDLLHKPVDCSELAARLRSALQLKKCTDQLKQQNERLDLLVRARTKQLFDSHAELVWRLAKAAECRDDDTGNHVVRVGVYAKLIGQAMGMKAEFCENLCLAATLHDIGKIGVPDAILRKPGKLSPQEWKIMQEHCLIGRSILVEGHAGRTLVPGDLSLDTLTERYPLLEMAANIATYHHEKWDGTGYPYGLAGEAIPLPARIVAIADVYDALRSKRPYKKRYDVEQALDIIAEKNGTHFDPEVYLAFLQVLEEILEAEVAYSDADKRSITPTEILQETTP